MTMAFKSLAFCHAWSYSLCLSLCLSLSLSVSLSICNNHYEQEVQKVVRFGQKKLGEKMHVAGDVWRMPRMLR